MARKFQVRTVTLQIIMDEAQEIEDYIPRECITGEASGQVLSEEVEWVSEDKAREILISQGSDPSFFGLDDEDDED